jgi:hypothetical protein
VIAINAAARKLGLEIGMTKTEAESCPGLLIRERSLALEASAHAALVDCVARFSPRCEDVSVDTVDHLRAVTHCSSPRFGRGTLLASAF